ncbi:MAG: tRNA 2-thiocytidine(32) synthetase TtcA [Desulfobacterales bacterium]|nr:tRNA 2-thiocytidine(32) synthetase TtcA [Desulfobacterales bacterium]
MISHGDRILVGLSGGKDSLTLMHMLSEAKRRAPIDFDLFPVYVDSGFPDGFGKALEEYAQINFGRIHVEYTDYGLQGHSPLNRENPCFLCSRLRRKRIFELADQFQCTKIALGHHQDDIIETLFLNMLYAGRMGTMHPAQKLFKGKFTIIRPFVFIEEALIQDYHDQYNLPQFLNPCPSINLTKRNEVKSLLKTIYALNPHVKSNLFKSMHNINQEYLL